jgi:Family of unknown function (DUF6188)
MQMREHDDHWSVLVSDGEVTQLRIDFALTLIVAASPDDGFEVRIGGTCILTTPDGATAELAPEDDPTRLAPALRLARLGVQRTKAFKDGHLEMAFGDGSTLAVPADPDYEAWTITGTNGARIVSTPSGELAVWEANEVRP